MILRVMGRENTVPWRYPGRWPADARDREHPGPWRRVDRDTWESMRAFLRSEVDTLFKA